MTTRASEPIGEASGYNSNVQGNISFVYCQYALKNISMILKTISARRVGLKQFMLIIARQSMTSKSHNRIVARAGHSMTLDPFLETWPVLACCLKPVHATNQYKVDWTRHCRESTVETWDTPNASKDTMVMAVPFLS